MSCNDVNHTAWHGCPTCEGWDKDLQYPMQEVPFRVHETIPGEVADEIKALLIFYLEDLKVKDDNVGTLTLRFRTRKVLNFLNRGH